MSNAPWDPSDSAVIGRRVRLTCLFFFVVGDRESYFQTLFVEDIIITSVIKKAICLTICIEIDGSTLKAARDGRCSCWGDHCDGHCDS